MTLGLSKKSVVRFYMTRDDEGRPLATSSFPWPFRGLKTGAPNGSVPQNICSSGTFLLAGRCGRNSSLWKESVAGKKIIQGVRGDLKSRIAATGYLYGLLTTQDLNCAL